MYAEMPLTDCVGVSVDNFTQFMGCLIVLFKLQVLDEPGWDVVEVKKRLDVYEVLDKFCDIIDQVGQAVGMVDADGPRSGLFFKTTYLLRAVKALFAEEMKSRAIGDEGQDVGMSMDPAGGVTEDFVMSSEDEIWLSNMFGPSWDFDVEGPIII